MIFDKVFRLLLTTITGVIIARYLEPTGFGELNYAISFVSLFITFSTLGMDGIIVKYLVKNKNKENEILGTAFKLKLFGSLLGYSFISLYALFIESSSILQLLLLITGISLLPHSFDVIKFYFESQIQAKHYIKIQTITTTIISAVKLLFIYFNAPLYIFAIIFSFEYVLIASGLLITYTKSEKLISSWNFDAKRAKMLLKESLPLILSGIMVSLYMKIDQVMITNILSPTETGYYAAAVKLSESWFFIPVAISGALFPSMIQTSKHSTLKFTKRFIQLNSLFFYLSLFLAIILTLFSKQLVLFLYGEAYLQSATILSIHIWSAIFVFFGVAAGKWLLIKNLQIYSTITTSISAIINIIANIVLLPKMGVVGAAYATLFAYGMAGTFNFLFFKKTRELFFIQVKSLFLGKI